MEKFDDTNPDAIISETKTFAIFFAIFLKSRVNFEYFGKKDDPDRFCFSEITASENVLRYTSKTFRFRVPFEKRHSKRGQVLLTSTSQHLYLIH